jgi:glycosyltransferase involved in cell wall biosynthesis
MLQRSLKEVSLKPVYLPFKWSGKINKLLNIIFMYYENLVFLRREIRNHDLVWIALTSSIANCFVFIYPLIFPSGKFYVQLFTPSVRESKIQRGFLDILLRLNLRFYKHIGGGLSKSISERYKVPAKKNIPVDVGMPDYGYTNKDFNHLKLVYIGTLQGREVWKSVEGFGLFRQTNPTVSITYDIIGRGPQEEIDKLSGIIDEYNLKASVKYHGPLSVEEVRNVFKSCNIGVSYAPITAYHQNPSTKTIEYFLAGMAVISTDIAVLREIVTLDVGVLCEDNAVGFAGGLEKLYANRNQFDSEYIRNNFKHYSIENVMKQKYLPYLEQIMNQPK